MKEMVEVRIDYMNGFTNRIKAVKGTAGLNSDKSIFSFIGEEGASQICGHTLLRTSKIASIEIDGVCIF